MAHEDSPQGHRQPPTRAELRAWRRWERKTATAEAGTTQATQAQAQDWRATGTYVHHIGPRARKALVPTHDHRTTTQALADAYTERAQTQSAGDWVQRMALEHSARTQRDATAFLSTAQQTAERTARTNVLFAVESLALALSIAASAWLLVDSGQRLGMIYGIGAYQAWSGVAHGIPKDRAEPANPL
jgi:hypothetical protein